MQERPRESDWKKFRKRAPEWRERYLSQANKRIIAALTDGKQTPTERFWKAKERMDEEARILVACLDGHSRSKMIWHLSLMFRHGMIEEADLEEFSPELRGHVLALGSA